MTITSIRNRLRRYALLYETVLFRVGHAFFRRVLAPKPNRVLFATDAGREAKGNLQLVRDDLIARYGDQLDVYTSARSSVYAIRWPWQTLTLSLRVATSKVIVIDDYFPVIYQLRLPADVELIQLWHASGAFKKVGFARKGLPGGPGPNSIAHRGYTAAIVSSEGVREAYAKAFKMPVANVHATGIPKTDVLFDTSWVANNRESIRAELGIPADSTVVLVASTFRGHGQISANTGETETDWNELAEMLPGHTILVKNHPFTRMAKGQELPHPRVIDVTHREGFEPLLCAADLLVTDYSSVIFDAALLQKPVVYYMPDKDDYESNRGFFFDADSYVWGKQAHTFDELLAAIAKPTVNKRKFDAAVKRHLAACDGHATQRVVDELIVPYVVSKQ